MRTPRGMGKHPLHKDWARMKQRCVRSTNAHRYRDRGITVCPEWKDDFMSFYHWAISNGWKEGLECDRIDNDKGYSPENCRWATREENMRNREVTFYVEIDGVTKPLMDWCEIHNADYGSVYSRIQNGWDPAEAVLKPFGKFNRHQDYNQQYSHDGVTMNIAGWCKSQGLDRSLVHRRIHKHGWSFEEALGFVPHVNKNGHRY